MALHSTLHHDKAHLQLNKGFTFVELLIAVVIMAVIMSLGLMLSMDFYRTYAFNYEKDLIVAFLQQTRSKAMANISQSTHGMQYNAITHTYEILKEGAVAQTFEANDAIAITWNDDIVFNQVEGECTTCSSTITITLTGLGKTSQITINNEGRINY